MKHLEVILLGISGLGPWAIVVGSKKLILYWNNKITGEEVQRRCTIVDLIKQRKLKLRTSAG